MNMSVPTSDLSRAAAPKKAKPVYRTRLQVVLSALFLADWDWTSEPTGLPADQALALKAWRRTSSMPVPITRGSTFGLPAAWLIWIASQRDNITDRTLFCALNVAAHACLRGTVHVPPMPGRATGAARLDANAALTVLREVVDCLDRDVPPSALTLEAWDDHDAGAEPPRLSPTLEVRAAWARAKFMSRFSKWLKAEAGRSTASQRHVVLDVERMVTALGLAPKTAQVDAWLKGQEQARRLRSSWKQYVLHCIEKLDRPRPGHATAGATGRPSIEKMEMPPVEVCTAIKVLVAKLTVSGLHKLRVSDYLNDRGQRTIMVATSGGRKAVLLTIAEHVAVQTVRAWAANRGEAALVPRRAGEAGAMSVAGLRRVVRSACR